jgi:tetratricopeptide (TPR) repeat protein
MSNKIVQLPPRRQSAEFRPVHEAVTELNNIALMRGAKYQHIATGIIEMKRAIAVQPNSRELWANMAALFWKARQYEEGLACADRSMTMGVIEEAAHVRALILEDLGRIDEAEEYFTKALAINPNYLNAKWCRSMMRLALGDYERGWEEYETRIPFRQQEGKKVYPKFPAPYWKGEPIEGKRMFCCIEQGIGDTIMFSRFLPWLHEQVGPQGSVHLCCGHEIMVLLWKFVESGIVEYVPEGTPIPECDYSVVIGSLPFHSHCTLDNLRSDPGLIRKRVDEQMRIGKADVPKPLGPNAFKVGICWTGNPAQERNDERSILLELMLTLAEHPNVWLYSLQVGPGQDDINRLGAKDLVCDLGTQCRDRGLTVACTAILQMDLVITCCTSIAHMCGALGVKSWVVLCKNPYWVWMQERLDSPWYPSLRLFRQEQTDDWKSVMQHVRDELFEMVDARRIKPLEVCNG